MEILHPISRWFGDLRRSVVGEERRSTQAQMDAAMEGGYTDVNEWLVANEPEISGDVTRPSKAFEGFSEDEELGETQPVFTLEETQPADWLYKVSLGAALEAMEDGE